MVGAAQLNLDDHHVLVTSDWEAALAGSDPLKLESTYLLRRSELGLQILAYLNHRDITAVLMSLGGK